ncbi:T9SS type B sorting domain-containing protein [Gillisia limnaea]|uniref:Ig-like domain-containing protein n=1 Tax=Gillisia limnaea (strain DSM 15749 / LMG 21470 / R-8282) TaxID=865937 RepID=H2BYQ6_GILLR|nr:T9SS type B sorting domain-containing protein [Gillisia limnaea]EHQ01177.1 hypothetical protein Gilli_0465 [Gillisia limnaea DSM 15749]
MKNWLLLFLLLNSFQIFAQLGFCKGSKGDPIFHETFGAGTSTGSPLSPGTTNYVFVSQDPQDGEYTISDEISLTIQGWHPFLPETVISNGRALIVNAGFSAGKFHQTTITGLCENTTYEFSAYLMNIYNRASMDCENGGIPINVKFEIWDETDTILLKQGNTGPINSTNSAEWEQYALTFQTQVGQESVILKMFNNGEGGCGNDLAIDDIIFRSCGDLTEIIAKDNPANPYRVCEENTPVSVVLKATPDFSVYTGHEYQWQVSDDNETWSDIAGETGENFSTPLLTSSTYYRVKVAEDAVNLNNNLCSSASEAFFIKIILTPEAPRSLGNISICSNEDPQTLRVEAKPDETVNWYDALEGGNLLAEGSLSFLPPEAGTFYAEAVKNEFSCTPGPRTPVSLEIFEVPNIVDEVLQLCPDAVLQLDAGVDVMQYLWNTGEITSTINTSIPGNFSVTITTQNGCSEVKNFEVNAVEEALIAGINSEENRVIINTINPGTFEYSLDGVNFQGSNIFEMVPGGIYTSYVRDLQQCFTATLEFPHIVVPRFITPNNDGYNDYFQLNGVSYFEASETRIFNRYGKLILAAKGETFKWDGTLNGRPLPADDYWYWIFIEGFEPIKGNFSLVR